MNEVTDYSVFAYLDEIIVELRGRTAEGEFTSVTYQFELTRVGEDRVRPCDTIDSAHEDTIDVAVSEAGYEIETE